MSKGDPCGRRLTLRLGGAAAVGVASGLWGEWSSGSALPVLVSDLCLGIVGIVLTSILYRRPLPIGLAVVALGAVAPTGITSSSVAVLYLGRRGSTPLAVAVGAVNIVALTVRGLWRPTPGLPFGWYLLLVVFGTAALVGWGALARARAALIASLKDRAARAEAEQGRRVAEARAAERAAMAREMHDVLAHRLSLAATYAGALEYRPDVPPERLSQAAGVIRATVHQALNELREVIAVLREDTGGDGTDRPVPALADLPELVEESRAVGTPVELRDELADPAALPAVAGRTAYRVVQEALTNARKHAPGQPVRVALDGSPGSTLVIDISNPLSDKASSIPGTGTGLVGLTERVRLAGGRLDHRAMAGEFRLRASLPWPA